jgi:hypothetical protein
LFTVEILDVESDLDRRRRQPSPGFIGSLLGRKSRSDDEATTDDE